MKRGFVQSKGGPASVTGPSVPLTGAIGSRVPVTGALLIVTVPGFNCIGPRGASKNIGLGQTSSIQFFSARYIKFI